MPTPFDPSKLDLDINKSQVPEDVPETTSETPIEVQDAEVLPESTPESIDPLETVTQDSTPDSPEVVPEEVVPEIPENNAIVDDNDIIGQEDPEQQTVVSDDALLSNETEVKDEEGENSPKIIDINLTSFKDISELVIDEKYDFVTLEPSDSEVKIIFKTGGVEQIVKYIKYPVYSNILLTLKQVAHLPTDIGENEAEGKGSIQMKDKTYDVIAKVAPGGFGEKIFLKLKENTEKKASKKTKKTSIGKIFGFLGAILFVGLILGGMFITFIILNAQTVEDVKFFSSLGINLNDINTFISRIVTFIFSIVLFIETVVLAIFLFKFIWTKKAFKRKRVVYGMIATILLLVTFASATAWMVVDGKIKGLPNWQELAYGDIQVYDNDRFVSEAFDKAGSLIQDTEALIGPVSIRYDLTLFESNEAKKGFQTKKYIWNIGGEKIEELDSILIKDFTEEGNYEVTLVVEQIDLRGETIEKTVDNIPSLSVTHSVDVIEEVTRNGGKIMKFDGEDLKELGKLEWYFASNLENPVHTGYSFKPAQVFFEETIVAMNIVNDNIEESRTKVFVVGGEKSTDIKGEIKYDRSLTNDLQYTLQIKNPETNFGDGFIEEFEWKIGEKIVKKQADPTNLEKSSQIEFTFKNYGDNEVSLLLRDASGKTSEISTVINIPRNMKLRKNLDIWNDDEKLTDVRYLEKGNEYFVDELGVPTTLKFDARFVRPENLIYSLKEVSWDFGNNNNIDATGKSTTYDVVTEGNQTVVVNYKFIHRTNPEDVINMKEYIYIEGVKKEAIVDFKIEKDTDYVPVTVRFDASKSTIKNDDVVKFEYDYGDGVVEIRDAINPGHKYTKAGDYTIKLTITGRSGKKYSGQKKLILKPEPQDVKIGVSLKKSPVGQGIDFSSDDSDGQITEYFWDFGDGNTSVEANPTHAYSRSGRYEVKLRVDFANSNSLIDTTEIEVYEE